MTGVDTKENGRFKLPGSSLDEVFKVVQGYASVGKLASLSDISKSTGMHVTAISKNVGFLLSVGLLEGGQNKAPTEVGKRLGLALMHNVPDEVETILSDLVAENEFLKNILAAVRIRKGMDESALRAHVAYTAGQSKTVSTSTGTGAIVELLRRSGHLKTEDGKLVVGSPTPRLTTEPTAPEKPEKLTEPISILAQTSRANSPFSISIKVEVHCEPKDLDDLGSKLRKVLDDFGKQDTGDPAEE